MLKCLCCFDNHKEKYRINEKLVEEKQQHTNHITSNKDMIEIIVKDIESENEIVTVDMNTNVIQSDSFSYKVMCILNGSESNIIGCIFSTVKVLFLIDCDHNFVYNNLNTHTFPNLFRLYSNSPPSAYSVMHRHQHNPGYVAYISTQYYDQYFDSWWDEDIKHVKYTNDENIQNLYDKYEKITLN